MYIFNAISTWKILPNLTMQDLALLCPTYCGPGTLSNVVHFFFFSFYFQNWLTAWIYLSKAALPYVPNHMALEYIEMSVKEEGGKT